MAEGQTFPAGSSVLTPRERRSSLIAVIACITVTGLSLGATMPLLSISLASQGVSSSLIGLNTAMPQIANLMITPFIPRLLRRYGVMKFLITAVLISACAVPTFYLIPNLGAWFVIRFVMGFGGTGLFVVSEFWINQLATQENRGKLMGLYGTILSCGFALGPFLLIFTGHKGFLPFAMIGGISLFGLVPLVLFGSGLTPKIEGRPKHSFIAILFAAPAATLAGLVYGATETDIFNLLPVYALRSGHTEQMAALILSVFAAGNIFCQMPLGYIADKMNKRLLLLICASAGLAGTIAMPFAIHSVWTFVPVLFLYGGVVAGLYSVGLTYLGERFRGADLAAANSAFVMMYAMGALTIPPLSGIAMDWWDPHGLMLVMGAICLVYIVIAGVRALGNRG
ncbi:MAG: MFS transporter [Parvibaculaceae bacterium]|nr:MFS transporter [Parvibaculaceae bacterium]